MEKKIKKTGIVVHNPMKHLWNPYERYLQWFLAVLYNIIYNSNEKYKGKNLNWEVDTGLKCDRKDSFVYYWGGDLQF